MEKCLSEGVIQAFLDGELGADALEDVTRHIAYCDDCAIALSEAENETAFAFAALEQEFNALVPTQRLWTKINCSIEEERRAKSAWQRFLSGAASVGFYLSRPSASAFASLLFVVGVFSVLWFSRPLPNISDVRVSDDLTAATRIVNFPEERKPSAAPSNISNSDAQVTPEINMPDSPDFSDQPRIVKADAREIPVNRPNRAAVKRMPESQPDNINSRPAATTLAYIPGEDSYVKTIATLKDTIDGGREMNMKPSSRFAIERDLAVIDDAIKKMQAEVRKNPKNEAAKQILFTSYQNKIDLLNSVSERSDLIASIR